ncbi:MAG: COX15/CtaA family protein [Alphaproteobacteria bacterium]|nr:COX15/CtaA family protein [Alphaproteobacteria bacterium]
MTSADTSIPKPFSAPETDRAMFWWLVVVGLFVCAMILVGGATRLTDSGLSITEWRPVTGAIPPLTQDGWERELELYRQIPEYQMQNRGMSMAEFQFIYWWEWGHRQLGRTLGLVYFLPFVFFLWSGRAPTRLRPRLWVLFALGGLQGAIGWWMVSSGLTERLDVSQYRLATHLTMAFLILGLTLWTALELRYGETRVFQHTRYFPWAAAFWTAVLGQVALGAFVAGLDAGTIHTTWPGFNGQLIPDGYLSGMPFWQAIFESRPAVQLNHRWFAYMLVIAAGALAWAYHSSGDKVMRNFALILPAVIAVQVVLGIVTLMAAAPLSLSLLHQGGAIALFLTAGAAAWTAARALPAQDSSDMTARPMTSRATSLTRSSPRS